MQFIHLQEFKTLTKKTKVEVKSDIVTKNKISILLKDALMEKSLKPRKHTF